jgi:hypothetical protein
MKKEDKDLLIKIGLIVGGYFLILRPILSSLGLNKTQQEKEEEKDRDDSKKEQENIKVGPGNRTYSDLSLNALAKELYDSANRFAYDYPIIMRSYAYFSGLRNADALYFLKIFAQRNGMTLYQWYVEKFQNSTNFKSVYMYKSLLDKYEKNYKTFGYVPSLFGDQSFDALSEKAVSYAYLVAGIKKG